MHKMCIVNYHITKNVVRQKAEWQFSEFERFIEGFRLGASIMLEAFILPQQSVIKDIC